MHKITGKQSMAARSLLKWNLYDLANRLKAILPKRIDSFEHGTVHLMEWENDELVRAFRKAGIQFKSDLEVTLAKSEADSERLKLTSGEGARVVLAADQSVVSDSTAEKVGLAVPPVPGEEPPKD